MNLYRCAITGTAALIGFGLSYSSANAAGVAVTNSSFEEPVIAAPPADQYINGLPTGWSDLSADGAFVETNAALGFTGGDGAQYAGLNGGGIYQDLGVTFQPNTTYTVDIAGAHRSSFTNGYMEFGLFSSDDLNTPLGDIGFIDIQGFWSGSGNPDGDDVFNTFRDASVLSGIGSGALGDIATLTTGAATPTGNVTVFIRRVNDGFRLNFDNVRVDAVAVPEPTSTLLVFGGLMASTLKKRR